MSLKYLSFIPQIKSRVASKRRSVFKTNFFLIFSSPTQKSAIGWIQSVIVLAMSRFASQTFGKTSWKPWFRTSLTSLWYSILILSNFWRNSLTCLMTVSFCEHSSSYLWFMRVTLSESLVLKMKAVINLRKISLFYYLDNSFKKFEWEKITRNTVCWNYRNYKQFDKHLNGSLIARLILCHHCHLYISTPHHFAIKFMWTVLLTNAYFLSTADKKNNWQNFETMRIISVNILRAFTIKLQKIFWASAFVDPDRQVNSISSFFI